MSLFVKVCWLIHYICRDNVDFIASLWSRGTCVSNVWTGIASFQEEEEDQRRSNGTWGQGIDDWATCIFCWSCGNEETALPDSRYLTRRRHEITSRLNWICVLINVLVFFNFILLKCFWTWKSVFGFNDLTSTQNTLSFKYDFSLHLHLCFMYSCALDLLSNFVFVSQPRSIYSTKIYLSAFVWLHGVNNYWVLL